jgi:ketosteroid isomerase-like protein
MEAAFVLGSTAATERSDMRTPRELSESYWAAECRRDVDAVVEHYHPDGTYEDAGGRRHGHAEIRRAYADSAREYPGLEVRIVREFTATPDCSALEYDATLIDHDGRRFRVLGVNVVVVRDDRLLSVRSYEDPPRLETVGQ